MRDDDIHDLIARVSNNESIALQEAQALRFLQNPPQHDMHDWFTRQSMTTDRLDLTP